MKKPQLTTGQNAYALNIRHIVTAELFAKALAQKYYQLNTEFPAKLSKTDAKNVLMTHMFWHGAGSAYEGLDHIGDDQEILNAIYAVALIWVTRNYPYLNNMQS